ncbi:MAG: VWA domain-containing protein [Pyrinomonadaceae bacterium]
MRKLLTAFLLCSALAAQAARAQSQQTDKPAAPDDEVLSVNTALVQTDVRVYDRTGHFVDNLRRDQFELRVDGRVVPISFFELVEAGGAAEAQRLLAASRTARTEGATTSAASGASPPPSSGARSRTFYFFVDDMHLSVDSLMRTRKAILNFVEHEMTETDQALVVSTTNSPGFLQQLTGNRAALAAAVSRLNFRGGVVEDAERPAMNDVQAQAIERNNTDAVQYFVDATMRESAGFKSRSSAELNVRRRARMLVERSVSVADVTLGALRDFVGVIARTRGQKLAYFISDGFVIDTVRSDTTDRLRRLTDAAARAGVVFYTLDAHGLDVGLPDASGKYSADVRGLLARSGVNETLERQDVLHAIAVDTGGRPIRNTNALGAALTSVAAETSRYYLLAWRPEDEEHKGKFKRLEVRIADRPELTVRARGGFFDATAPTVPRGGESAKTSPNVVTTSADALKAALGGSDVRREVPVSLSVGYMNVGGRGAAVVSLQLPREVVAGAEFDVACVVFDDKGTGVASFRQKLGGAGEADGARSAPVGYSQLLPLAPGLYQIRVAARDPRDGRVGVALDWLEIPDAAHERFALSSLFVGERADESPAAGDSTPVASMGIRLNADRRFARDSQLRFIAYIYNAARTATGSPDLTIAARVTRANQTIIDSPPRQLPTANVADPARIPYGAEVSLAGLPPGSYTLELTTVDRARHATATQRIVFVIK